MEPPNGFVRLRDAADTIGRKINGSRWRPIAEVTVEDIATRANPVVEQAIKLIAEHCESGKIAASYRSITGADPLDCSVWRLPHWRNYFAAGTIDLELPFLDNDLRPILDGRTTKCSRELFLKKQDVDLLLKELSTPKKGRAGAPAEWDWEDYAQKFRELWKTNGDFRKAENKVDGWNSQAAAAKTLLDYITRKGAKGPDQKTVERYIRRWISEIDPSGT